MNKYLVTAVVISSFVGICLIAYSKPILIRPLVGAGRVLFPPIDCEVRVDGNPRPDHICFRTTAFSDRSAETIVVYSSVKNEFEFNDVIVIDVFGREAGLPNASEDDYYLVWNYFLFQSESGAAWAPFSGPKFDPHHPDYVFEPNYIKFNFPSRTGAMKFEMHLRDE